MKTGALILSSGLRSAHPEGLNPMQIIGSISAVQRLIMTFYLAGADPIVIVAAKEDLSKLEKYSGRNGVVLIQETKKGAELFENVRLGLDFLKENCDAAVITPVDIPLFSVSTVKALLANGSPIAVPTWQGKPGHPLFLVKEAFPHILSYAGKGGLRQAVRNSGIEQAEIPVADEGVHIHSEQFEECEKIIAAHNRDQWHPVTKVRIAKEEIFFGPGTWQLLSLIETTGSVRLACEVMNISYSKAWKLLNNLEKQAGFLVIVRKKGGKNGGETYLTEAGKNLLTQYEAFEEECNQAVRQIFAKHFSLNQPAKDQPDTGR